MSTNDNKILSHSVWNCKYHIVFAPKYRRKIFYESHRKEIMNIYQINENLWEGSFYPRLPDGKRKKFNVYAKTKAECEKKLAKMIAEKKAEIAKQKKAQKKG